MRLSENRWLLGLLLITFTVAEAYLGWLWAAAGFRWRPLLEDPGCRAGMLDFTATAVWVALFILDAAREQRRSGWAWMPLLILTPTLAILLFQLTAPRRPA